MSVRLPSQSTAELRCELQGWHAFYQTSLTVKLRSVPDLKIFEMDSCNASPRRIIFW